MSDELRPKEDTECVAAGFGFGSLWKRNNEKRNPIISASDDLAILSQHGQKNIQRRFQPTKKQYHGDSTKGPGERPSSESSRWTCGAQHLNNWSIRLASDTSAVRCGSAALIHVLTTHRCSVATTDSCKHGHPGFVWSSDIEGHVYVEQRYVRGQQMGMARDYHHQTVDDFAKHVAL